MLYSYQKVLQRLELRASVKPHFDFPDKVPLGYDLTEKESYINLDRLIVPKQHQSKGLGTQFMQRLVDYADEHGKEIRLSPTTVFGASSVARLQQFYKRFGFISNKGKKKDFSHQYAMVRHPQPKVESAAQCQTVAAFPVSLTEKSIITLKIAPGFEKGPEKGKTYEPRRSKAFRQA